MRVGSLRTLSAREWESIRERRAFEQAEEQKEREERERPIREAEAALTETHRQLRQNALNEFNACRPDPGFALPESVSGKRMSRQDAERFNADEARKFRDNNPDFYNTLENREKLFEYLTAQGVNIADEATYGAAFERLQYLGLLDEKPESQPEPVENPSEQSQPDDGSMSGYDPDTGEQRTYSAFEIQRMSAQEFKLAFRITKDQQILARRNW